MRNNVLQQVKFLNVGHGDSSLIYIKDNDNIEVTVVIDLPDSEKLINELDKESIKIIDLIIISHTDADHCKGLSDFIEEFSKKGEIKKICYNIDRNYHTRTLELIIKRIIQYANMYNIVRISGLLDTNILEKKIISHNGTELSILYPDKLDEDETYIKKNVNDMSIVCQFKNSEYNVLFTGDLGIKGWKRLFYKNASLSCDILKMPHHGAYYDKIEGLNGLDEIVERLNPQVAIISSGNNKNYKHPAEKTIKLLKKKSINIYCTQYTDICNNDICEGNCECSGDICVLDSDIYYTVKTEYNMKNSLKTPVCIN